MIEKNWWKERERKHDLWKKKKGGRGAIYKINATSKIVLHYKNETTKTFETLELNEEESKKIFHRTDEIALVEVYLNASILR